MNNLVTEKYLDTFILIVRRHDIDLEDNILINLLLMLLVIYFYIDFAKKLMKVFILKDNL